MVVKSLTLDKIKQLVDINGDMTNFRAVVSIEPSDNEASYELAFVNQTILDNAEDFSYTSNNGPYKHSFTSSDDMYQNHFLCLRSSSPLQVNVSIDVEELPTNTVAPLKHQVEEFAPPTTETKLYQKLWFKILLVCIAAFVVYWLFFRKSSSKPAATSEHQRMLSMIPSIPVVEHVPVVSIASQTVIPEVIAEVIPEVVPEVIRQVVPEVIPEVVMPVEVVTVPLVAGEEIAKPSVVTFSEDLEYKPKSDFTMRLLERLKHK